MLKIYLSVDEGTKNENGFLVIRGGFWGPIYNNFEGERAPKKRDFFVKVFQKIPKNGFFKNLPAAQKIWPNQGLFTASGELGKSIWST